MNTQSHSIRYFLFAVFAMLLCVCSCHRAPSAADRLLDCVDSLCYVDPDSAVVLVSQIPDSTVSTWPEAARMRYHLMHIKALDKAYLDITGDTVMPTVLSYYQNLRDRRFLPEAYFYSGRVCADIGDAPQAMEYYTQALQATEGTEQTQQLKILKAVIYSQMGVVSRAQNLMGDALDYARLALEINLTINNTTGTIFNLCDLADYYSFINYNDTAWVFVEKAEEIADSAQLETMWSKAKFSKAIIYYKTGRYQEALGALRETMPHLGSYALHNARYYLASLYHLTGQIDSASYYYHELINDSVVFDKAVAYKELAQMSLIHDQYELADSLYYESFYAYDLARVQTQSEATKKVQQVYNYQLQEKKAQKFEVQNREYHLRFLILICLIVVLFLSVLAGYYYFKSYRLKTRSQMMNLRKLEHTLRLQSEEYINESTRQIQQLEDELVMMTSQNETLRHQLEMQKQHLENLVLQSKIRRAQICLERSLLQESDFYKKLQLKLKNAKPLSNQEWDEIDEVMKSLCTEFMNKLDDLQLSEIERRISLLAKLEMPVYAISILVGRSKSSISMARSRLFAKKFGKVGQPEDWDTFICSL